MRLRKRTGTREILEQHSQRIILQPKEHKGRWQNIFGEPQPLFVELGMGKGRFISNMAQINPGIHFIGIDVKDELVHAAMRKADILGDLSNLRLALVNIMDIAEVFGAAEVDRFFINFCDPWPKKRHAKRRLTDRGFLEQYRKILKPNGQIHFKTDSEPLFEYSLNQFSEAGYRLRNITFDLHQSEYQGLNVMTEYEQKFVERGMKIYRCEALV